MISKKKVDLSEERQILTHMIVSTPFLTQLRNIATPKLFESSFSRIIVRWVWDYFNQTAEAPGKDIENIYIKRKKEIRDENDVDLIEKLLRGLSKDWEVIQNVPYAVKNAIDFFKLRSLNNLKEKINDAVESQDASSGERLVAEYTKIDKLGGKGVDLLRDSDVIAAAFSMEYEQLFTFPGALGEALGTFVRGDFFSIMAAMKRGKTHYLWYTGYRAMQAGLRVLFVSLEMTQEQMIRRMWQTFAGKPKEKGLVLIPEFVEEGDGYAVVTREKKYEALDVNDIKKRQSQYKRIMRTGGIKLVAYPSYGATVEDIKTELTNLEYYDNFIPDIIIVDYADLLRPANERTDYRHQLDHTWKGLRGIAADRSLLMVTASQTGRATLDRDAKPSDTAEDYRKLAHITKGMFLNQGKREKEDGIMRIHVPDLQREGKTKVGDIVVLQCYDIGRAYLDSKRIEEVDTDPYKEK